MLVGTSRPPKLQNAKWILKRIAASRFGEQFAVRKKSGFALPLAEYYASDAFIQFMQDEILPSMSRRGVFDSEHVRNVWENREQSGRQSLKFLWSMISFETWAISFLDGELGG